MSRVWDVIVVGVGGMGAATCLELARRGARVLGLERFSIAHAFGSSSGESRIIRKAYFEAPEYVPLVTRAYTGWRALERETERELMIESGLLLVGRPQGSVVPLSEAAGRAHGFVFERPSREETRERFPDFSLPDDAEVLFEPDAGILYVEACVEAAAVAAQRLGAVIHSNTIVRSIEPLSEGVRVETERDSFLGARVVLALGAWSGSFLGKLGPRLSVRRKLQLWLEVEPNAYPVGRCPIYGFELENGFFYGFPALEPGSVKVADHTGGEAVPDPTSLDRDMKPTDAARVLEFASRHLPRATGRIVRHSACMYTMTPDEHFVIDRHPEHENVIVACGFSGHGFKFAPTVASALADLALDGRTDLPIDLFSASRPALE